MSSDHELLVEEDQQQHLEGDLTGRTSPSRGSYGTFNGRLPAYSSPAPSSITETKTRSPKRYRLSFLILLGFDVSLVTFLSIISYLNSRPSDHQIAAYFTINLNSSVFDLVMLSVIRFILDFLFYLLLGWITRIVLCITTIVSTFYIPAKAFFYWKTLSEDSHNSGDIQYILILLLLFAAFVMPWLIAFFFEFKYLPTEIARLSITSWKDARPWCCPWMLVRPVITRNTTGPQVQQLPHQLAPLNRFQSLDYVFRTPLSSLRTSPVGFQTIEDLTPINEERSISPSPECDQLSSTDEMYIQQGSEALERLRIMTSSNDGWVLEKNQNGIKCFSYQGESRKIWKSEVTLSVPVEQLWTVLFQRSHEWNSNVVLNEVVHSIDHKTDVVYTVSSSVGPVSPRDFVSVRRWSLIEGTYYCASVSTLHDSRPPQRDKVRGENGPCGYVVIPVDSQSSLFLWLLDTDIKGWVPQSVVDQTMTSTLMTANTNLRMYLRSAN